MPTERVTLRAGEWRVDVLPALGGSLARFSHGAGETATHFMRPMPEAGDVLAVSCFPLVPFSGRIRGGRLRFRGRLYSLPLNVPGEPNALHGEGWQRPWTVVAATADSIELALHGSVWPFPFRAGQRLALRDGLLVADIWIVNEGGGPMPAGIGLHPWFTATPKARLTMSAAQVWLTDAGHLFDRVAGVPAAWDFSRGRALAGSELCHGFGGWNGKAILDWPESGARLAMKATASLGHLVVYAPTGKDFFCVEPVSHSVDAFNLAEQGVEGTGTVVLARGERLAGRVEFLAELGQGSASP